jgi:multiple sugar transport system permease protein
VTGREARAESRAGWGFVSPALLLIGVFFAVPVAGAFVLSFTDFDLYSIGDFASTRFVGLKNYRDLLGNPLFWTALRNTTFFVVVGGPLSVAVSLAAAVAVNSKLVRWKPLFRSAFFAPWVTTLVAVAIVWRYLYHPQYGLFNAGLALLGLGPVDWLGNPRWAMPAIILLSVWKNFGYNMLVFLAGLQAIPEELYEAAALDGAGAWHRFRHVTLPMLGPTFVFVGVVTMIASFQIFSEPYVMTQGGPLKATETLVLFMYEEGFRWWRLGSAAAIAVVLFLLTLAGTLIQLRLRRGGGGEAAA